MFNERYREDAQAVVREMAGRARWNVETLVDRLQTKDSWQPETTT